MNSKLKQLKEFGIKLTPQRLAILEYLNGNRDHPSAEMIYKAVKEKFPMTSFATVYSTLEVLTKSGVISELKVDPERRRYDPETSPHHHLICTKCRKIVDINAEVSIKIPDYLDREFEIHSRHIEFYGICQNCSKGGANILKR